MKKLSPKRNLHHKTILLLVSGSIAAYKIGDLVTLLREQGARVPCVMTPSAKHFVTPLVLRALSGERVYDDFFTPDSPYDVLHTTLAEQADLVLAAPASADLIARLAAGMADDLASCIVLATQKPVMIVPAMNDQMLNHPLTQQNIKKLKGIGYHFVDPVKGHLVCGKEAVGHIASAETILSEVCKKF
jgi:phosphopantothenoylcysteine synthetase/decarboxylase